MAERKKVQTRWMILIGAVIFIAVLVRFTFQQTRFEYQVCTSFGGGTHCATAKGATAQDAIRSAKNIDCGLLADGRDANIQCMNAPADLTRLK
jgi:hypoxanthine-guanine phosphoribosyltransferase